MDIKYNIYYSLSSEGPWTLSNNTPIDHSDDLMEYFIDNLTSNTAYYITIVGGYIENEEFIPLMSQPIGPVDIGATTIGSGVEYKIKALTYNPSKSDENNLTHKFGVII